MLHRLVIGASIPLIHNETHRNHKMIEGMNTRLLQAREKFVVRRERQIKFGISSVLCNYAHIVLELELAFVYQIVLHSENIGLG